MPAGAGGIELSLGTRSRVGVIPAWDDLVAAMFADLCCGGARGDARRGLLLDVTLSRVYVAPSLFDKAGWPRLR